MRIKQIISKAIKQRTQSSGFTLIELSIVIIIAGLITLPLLQYYKIYQINKELSVTRENIESAASAIQLFPIRYPCPSDRSLPPTDPNYGVEKCTGVPNCNGLGNQGVCKTTGNRDADGDGSNDTILIGGVPFKLSSGDIIYNMKAPYMLDGWGNKMTYAVSVALSSPTKTKTTNDFNLGVIGAISEHSIPTAGVNDDAQFVIVSHGKDGAGTFTLQGVALPCVTGRTETENCDEDGTFVQALGMYEGSSASYYDDVPYFYKKSPGELWSVMTNSIGDSSPHINNINEDNVGINADTPQVKLDVDGTITADTIRSDTLCTQDGASCMDGNDIYDLMYYNTCPQGRIVTRINNGDIVCGYPSFDAWNATRTCPMNTFVTSIYGNGCIVCSDGSEVCS